MQTERNGARRRRSAGFSLIELLIVIAIILVIASIAVPKYNAIQMSSNELKAINEVQTIQKGVQMYLSTYNKYPSTLGDLGSPANGQPGPSGAGVIPDSLAKGQSGQYKFTLQSTPTGYLVNANPIAYNSSGRRSLFTDESNIIRENWGPEPATAQSKEINAAK